ncbi:NADH-quinone oxidoreductase subunit NuoK [Tepidibacillus decaturensis]|uniref:NADH-quinone oxidoreductase subunit K n=1 Tax=Tepidibacillus decaturensis TaxID=1413211 RepID=A0A135L6P0_9BACI|nr:NADH-quinone oxidoreductase subunit NuoK [Tepidibacillus decaturensis]KXG44642.1 NADH dehydrogenase [Tepidibacillus decaturensis]
MVPLGAYLAVGAILFSLGIYGLLSKKNAIIVLLSVELMLNAVNVNLIAFSRFGLYANITGQIFTVFTITVAAAEAAVGLAILMAVFRNKATINVNEMDIMKR